MNPSITVPGKLRIRLHLIPFIAVLFLALYSQVVCPFLSSISLEQIMVGLMAVALLQLGLREYLFLYFSQRDEQAPVLVTQKASVISWLVVGAVASFYHAWKYPDFPVESHLKLLVGYWALGAGILAQVDHMAVERYCRKQGVNAMGNRVEHISRRLMQLIAIFALVPGLVMAIMAFRFVSEGYATPMVAYEVSFLVAVFFLLATLVAWQYGRTLRQDTQEISKALQTIRDGEFSVQLDTSRADELGRVAQGINQMAHGLVQREQIRDLFGRFVNPQIAEQVIASAEQQQSGCLTQVGEHKQVAVLMCDIRDFTAITETMAPEKLVSLLNGYFAEMVSAIQNHNGVVDKFIGDAVMAVFGLTDEQSDVQICNNAVAAATEMRQRLASYNQRLALESQVTLENGIGIHFGDVVAGCIGSSERVEYTVMGSTVNMAARIEGQCKKEGAAPLLFSREVAEHVAGSRQLGAFGLKGLAQPMDLFTTD